MTDVFLCDGVRTPIGRYGGALASVRTDDLAAVPLRALVARHPRSTGPRWTMSTTAAPIRPARTTATSHAWRCCWRACRTEVPAATVNRLCGSSMDAVASCARAIRAGEAELMIAGGVEGMTRAPFVMPKADSAFSRANTVYDTTLGWRFVNPAFKQQFGVDSMPETAENVAAEFGVARADQDMFALRSQQRYAAARATRIFHRRDRPGHDSGPQGRHRGA